MSRKQPLTQHQQNKGDDRGLQETAEGAHPSTSKVKFLSEHITDKLKRSIHTDSVVKNAQQCLFNLRRLKKFGLSPKTHKLLQLRESCRTVSPPGTATAPPTTARISRGWCGLHNASPGANYLPSRTPTAPDVTGRSKRSSRTTTTQATACSPRYHPEGEGSTGPSKLGPRQKYSFYLTAIRLLNSHH